jgi:hypothetical protein
MSREHLSPARGQVRTGLGVIALAAALAMATSGCQSSSSKASVVGQDPTTSASSAAVGAPSKSASAPAGAPSSPAKAASSAPAAGGGFKVGQQVKVGDFTVVVHKVTYPYSNEEDQPDAGKSYLLLDVEVTNNSGKAQDFSSGLQFGLKDGSNNTYNETIVVGADGNAPDGSIAAGTSLRGPVAFQIPAGDKGLKFSFMGDVVSGDLTYIDLGK